MESQPGPQILTMLHSLLEFYHGDEEGHSWHQEANISQVYLNITNVSKMCVSHLLLQQGRSKVSLHPRHSLKALCHVLLRLSRDAK